jgi:hypothetical protein
LLQTVKDMSVLDFYPGKDEPRSHGKKNKAQPRSIDMTGKGMSSASYDHLMADDVDFD